MRNFNIGDKVVQLKDLKLCTNPYHFKTAAQVHTIGAATDKYFSIYEIDLDKSLCGMDMYQRCNQNDGCSGGVGNELFLNLTLQGPVVKDLVERKFDTALSEDRAAADQKIKDLRARIERMQSEIVDLEKESPKQSVLIEMKNYVLKGLGLGE